MAKGKESKPHIGIFGRRNYGKSSLINSLADQDIAIVSDYAGTTTDPVKKTMEITGVGPVILIDTAGIDDTGELGAKRAGKSKSILKQIDFGILVINDNQLGDEEEKLAEGFVEHNIPYLIVHNKSDIQKLSSSAQDKLKSRLGKTALEFSAIQNEGREELIRLIRKQMPESAYKSRNLLGDLLTYGDLVLLITPIDIQAPEGRMILPQVQAIRDILDNDCTAVVVKEREVDSLLRKLNPEPALAVTDSQVFLKASASVPDHIPLTSFSTMLARYKGDFENYLKGTPYLSKLKDGDRLLILESCTHHVSCDDIGRVKIPRWISNFSGKQLEYDVVNGLNDLPRDIHDYAMVIQCGGCVLTQKQIVNRLKPAVDAGIPVTNYGMTIAYIHGIYDRAIAPFTGKKSDSLDYL